MKVVVPYPAVRNLLVQKYLGDKIWNWMTYLQEYDLDISPVNIVKGQGLFKLVVESTRSKNDEYELYEDENLLEKQVCYIHFNTDSWYDEMKYYLTHGTPPQ
jgi:hypothetical protein